MNERVVRHLIKLVERLECAAEEIEHADIDVTKAGTLVQRLMVALEGLQDEFSVIKHLDPRREALVLRQLVEDELYGENAGGPSLFDE